MTHKKEREESPTMPVREIEDRMAVENVKEQEDRRGRKRKQNRKKASRQKDVSGGITLVNDNAFAGCLPMGCCHCEKKQGLQNREMDDESGNAQLCTSFFNDGRCRMSDSSPCSHGEPLLSHLDGCKKVLKSAHVVDEAIGDNVGDKTTVHDNAHVGCLADGCYHHGPGFLPFICQHDVPSNAQLCQLSIDDHQCQMLGTSYCTSLVDGTIHSNTATTSSEGTSQVAVDSCMFMCSSNVMTKKDFHIFAKGPNPKEIICPSCLQQDGCGC